jgi:RraA family protein
MSNIGFRIFKKVNRPDKAVVEQFSGLPVANIADVMNRFKCVGAYIRPVNSTPLLGTAVTARVRSGDNLMFHKALDVAQPGDVIVIDGQGDLVNALVGENLVLWAMNRGVAGIVVDGAIRDVDTLRQLDFPVYAAGITPSGTYKHGAGEVNVPICCGRVVVNPGDIVVGDADGLVVIRAQEAVEVLEKAKAKFKEELAIREAISAGNWRRTACTDEAVMQLGCEIIDDVYR